MRFREEELTFKISDTFEDMKMDKTGSYKYPKVTQNLYSYSRKMELLSLLFILEISKLLKSQFYLEKTELVRPLLSKC
jgi:hypothetical protein